MMLARMPSAEIRLRKSGGGVFEITVDGKLTYSKKATGRFPTDEEVLRTLAS
jgi:selT/selW/selH-like putative selenoprotein